MAARLHRGVARWALVCALVLVGGSDARAQSTSAYPAATQTEVGPARGALVVAGGGRLVPEIWERFVELAGGEDARIVVIPGASDSESFPSDWGGLEPLRRIGAANITVLHTRDRTRANDEQFVAPLRMATGVWIPGGRQWRLTDAYLNTRVHAELRALLARGGVIGGTSAGASVQASYMVRGAPEGNQIMMAPGHEEGFGFLRDVAVDQHLLTRGRERDLLQVLAAYPRLLGIGIDEGTALVVQGDTAEVIGESRVAIYDVHDPEQREFYFLDAGMRFDLAARRVLPKP